MSITNRLRHPSTLLKRRTSKLKKKVTRAASSHKQVSKAKPETKTKPSSKPETKPSRESDQNGEGFFDPISDVVDIASDVVSKGTDVAGDVVSTGVDVAGDVISTGTDVAGDVISTGVDIADRAVDTGRDAVDSVTDRIAEAPGNIFERGRNTIRDLFGGGYKRRDSSLAEDREQGATVAVIDGFTRSEDEPDSPAHGESVESILRDFSGLNESDIQRYKSRGGGNLDSVVTASADDLPEALDTYVEERISGLLDGSSDAIEDILADDNSQIRTINQSLGAPEIRVARDIYGELNDNSDFRDNFLESSGLPEDASEKQVLQALVDQVAEARIDSDRIEKSEARYDRLTSDANDHGITTVVSAGNYGRFADTIQEQGVEVDEEFYRDVLVNEHVISVGATDDQGTSSIKDDTSTAFTSPHADADLSANGQQQSTVVDGTVSSGNGTSFAAPQVAASAAVLAAEYPDLTPEDIREILTTTAINPGLDSTEVGAGILQADAALAYADKMAA